MKGCPLTLSTETATPDPEALINQLEAPHLRASVDQIGSNWVKSPPLCLSLGPAAGVTWPAAFCLKVTGTRTLIPARFKPCSAPSPPARH